MKLPLNQPLFRLAGVLGFSVIFSWVALPHTPLVRPVPEAPPAVPSDLASFFPEDTLLYLEAEGLGQEVHQLLDSELARRVESSQSYAEFRTRPEAAELFAGLGFVQMVTGRPPHEALGNLLGERLSVGVVPAASEPALIAVIEYGAEDSPLEVVDLARRLAAMNEETSFSEKEYRGVQAAGLNGKLILAPLGRYLMLSSDADTARAVVDRLQDEVETFAAAEDRSPLGHSQSPIRFLARLGRIQELVGEGEWIPARQEQPLGSMLLGDLAEVASRCGTVYGDLDWSADGLRLQTRWPVDPSSLPERLRSFCHDQARAMGLPALATHETFLTLAAWRDLAEWWEDREQLMTDDTEKGFAEFDTTLATFLGGRRFSDDLLPTIEDDWVLVGARQAFTGRESAPDICFPAGALVMRSEDAESLEQEFRIALNSLMALINVERGQEGQAPFLLFSETSDGVTLHGARPVEGERYVSDVAHANLSPALTRVGDRLVLGTSEELVRDLARGLAAGEPARLPAGILTRMRLDFGPGMQALQDNLEALIGNAVLEEGKSYDTARFEWNLLMEIGAQLDELVAESRIDDDGFVVSLQAAWSEAPPVMEPAE